MLAVAAAPVAAQLRIVTYNTATAQNPGTQTARPSTATVLSAIGAEIVGGIAKPIDVLLLQEQFTMQATTQSFVDMLNGIYGAGVYARSALNGLTSDGLRRAGAPGLVYNTQTVQLIEEVMFGNVGTSTSQQPRSTMRYKLRPVGYDASADFYAYNSHYKSDTGVENNARRLIEAQAIRANSDALGDGVHALYVGDYNIQTSSGTAYQHLLSAGAGQAIDPINRPGSWNSNASFADIHTQSPANVAQYDGQTLGGLDDRFDIQLVTGELLDNEGMSYIPGTYHAFGNNGTHGCCNNPITQGTGAAPNVLQALMASSDHLPVAAHYQLPAKLGVQVAEIPLIAPLGSNVAIDVMISNMAPALVASGADELDFEFAVTGSLVGGGSGTIAALGATQVHQFMLDTSTPGLHSGMLTVTSASQQAAGALFTLPVEYQVAAAFLPADFNSDGSIDAIDLTAWQASYGIAAGASREQGDADGNGVVDGADFLAWQQSVGQPSGGEVASSVVPEPAETILVMTAASVLIHRRRLVSASRDCAPRDRQSWPLAGDSNSKSRHFMARRNGSMRSIVSPF
jgi:hypothetical protein